MQLIPFQSLVRDIIEDLHTEGGLCWQANALFTLQTATEAYMCGFFAYCNLCALHRKVVTINRKDIRLAIQIRGRDHVGGKAQVSDVGASNVSKHLIADPTEQRRGRPIVHYAEEHDWPADLRAKVAPKPVKPHRIVGGKGGGKGPMVRN